MASTVPVASTRPYDAQRLPTSYNAGWLLSEHQRIQDAFPPRGARLIAVDHADTLPILPSDYCLVVDTTAGNVNLTLPNPLTANGRTLVVKKNDLSSNRVTLLGTVDGTNNYPITNQNESATIIAVGGFWNLIGIT